MGGGFPAPQQAEGNAEPRSQLMQILPLLVLFAFSLLSALPNIFSTPPTPDPNYSFTQSSRYNLQRETDLLGVRYFINGAEVMNHPVIGPELIRQGEDLRKRANVKQTGPALSEFESNVEQVYRQAKYTECQRGQDQKEREREREVGLFALGTDWEKVRQIEARVIEACEEFKRLNSRRRR